MTPYEIIYGAFLSKILEDEWGDWEDAYVKEDLKSILLGAIPYFKFPRVDLQNRNDIKGFFIDKLNNYPMEIEYVNTLMTHSWGQKVIRFYDPDGNLVYDTWICPCCEKHYEVDYEEYDYCPFCGQRIDWSEEQEGE